MQKKIMVIGGAGYVGSELVPKLLMLNYKVKVLDLFMYGETLDPHENLEIVKGDMRNIEILQQNIKNIDVIIHLACISNDPSFDLDPELGKKINYDFFEPLVKISKDNGVKRFIYASSSSVYGLKEEKDTNENASLKPLTDYSKFKAMCEEDLLKYNDGNFTCVILRPATVCGYSRRQRFDLVVNLLTNLAFNKREITVFGGLQLRPNIHIDDMCRAYIKVLEFDKKVVEGQIFNAGYENKSVNDLANLVRSVIGKDVSVKTKPTDDNRSYHITSEKIKNVLGFEAKKNIKNSIEDINKAFLEIKQLVFHLNTLMINNLFFLI